MSTGALTAIMVWATYWVHASAGRKLANNGLLTTLWQVQAAAVSLALALAVFVFGLFPRSGKRVSYRAFLRRSSARPVIAWGISSLLLDGIVLLGFGHQEPNSAGASDGYGWAVSVACAVGLVSIASIALLFGRTIGAIDPVVGDAALTADRHAVIGEALRRDLLSEFAYGVLEESAERLNYEFVPSHREGGRVYSARSGGVVFDVSRRRLAAIGVHARRGNRALPQIHVWPGQRLFAAAPMVTVDPATPRRDRLRARYCVCVWRAGRDETAELLDALHADVLEHIRADRPIDVKAALATMTEMLRLAWQADRAHRHTPPTGNLARLVTFSTRGVKSEVIGRLTALVRAGAVSADEQIRHQTSRYPRALAALALRARASESVRACLMLYPRIYEAVISDVTDAGRLPVPLSGVGRRRIAQIFAAVLSFTNADVPAALDRARKTRSAHDGTGRASFDVEAAIFAVEQTFAANTVILAMLRQALSFGDVLTVQRVVPDWAPQDAGWLLDDLQSSSSGDAGEAALADMRQALDTERRNLAGMKLRLLRSALRSETEGAAGAAPETEASQSASLDPDPSVAAILDSLEPGTFWVGLSAAADQADQDLFPPAGDDEVRPDGWRMSGFRAQNPGLAQTFVQAALARPHLIASGEADPEYAKDHATAFIEAARNLAAHLPWAQRYTTPGDAEHLSGDLIGRMQKAAARARRHAAQQALALPLPEPEALRDSIARHYAVQEVVVRLFAWAGHPPLVEDPLTRAPLEFGQLLDRRDLTVGPEKLEHTATVLANGLAHGSIGELIAAVSHSTAKRSVLPERIDDRVRLAITALRRSRSAESGLDTTAPGIVVFVPNEPEIARLLTVTDRARDRNRSNPAGGPSARKLMLTRLGFNTPQLEWYLLGTMDAVPVLRTVAVNTIVVLDLAHGIECQANADPSAPDANLLHVTLMPESEHSARTRYAPESLETGSGPASNAIEEQITRFMTRVEIKMDLAISFTSSAGARVRVLAIADSRANPM